MFLRCIIGYNRCVRQEIVKRRVVITGGAGFIGAALANTLATNKEFEVVCIDNLTSGDWQRVNKKVTCIDLDISTSDSFELTQIMQNTEVLFHLAAVKLHNKLNSFNDLVQNNINGTQKILEAAGAAGTQKIVFTSSLYAYDLSSRLPTSEELVPKPSTFYGATKVFGESQVHINSLKYGFSYNIARLYFIYGPGQYAEGGYKSVIISNFERLLRKENPQVNGDGAQIMDFLYITDCVDALIKLSELSTNSVFNVSSGNGISILELTRKMIEIAPNGSPIFKDSDWTANTSRIGNNKKLKELSNWVPQVSLEQGLRLTWESLSK